MDKMIKAVLFDLDGVIVFTDRYHYLGWKKLADERGWAFDEELIPINTQPDGSPAAYRLGPARSWFITSVFTF